MATFLLFQLHFTMRQNNFPAAFVQTMLTAMGISEEWENDFWGSMSVQERSYVLTKAEQFYKEYICYERVCLQDILY